MAIDVKTTKTLGLAILPSVLARADEVYKSAAPPRPLWEIEERFSY